MIAPSAWVRATVLLGLAAVLAGARAHQPSDAYLVLQATDDGRIEQRLDIALRDLDRELALDADGDGALTWRELRQRWADIDRLADEALSVTAGGGPCRRVAQGAPLLDAHADGRYAVLQRTWLCGAGADTVGIDYRLFERSDPTHRGIARVDAAGGATQSRVLVPGDGPVTVSTGPAGPARAMPGLAGLAGFVAQGLHHIAIGVDHLLFLATLLMVAVWRRQGAQWVPRDAARSAWGEVLRLVTAFTVAHSLTLTLAAAGVLAPPAHWVEPLIALSVFVAAIDNLRPFLPGPRWATVAAFGLVHGFGFAGPLQDLGLRGADLALPLLGFNLGVEAGQLAVVALLMPLALRLRASAAYRRWIVRPGSALVAVLALFWTAERTWGVPPLPI